MGSATNGTRRRTEQVRAHVFVLAVAVACGIAGALGAVVFRALIQLVEAFAFSPEPLLVPIVAVLRGAGAVLREVRRRPVPARRARRRRTAN